MIKKSTLMRSALALAAFLAASASSAMPITFNFADGGGNRDVGTLLTQTVSGLTVSVTATGAGIHQNGTFGLGVSGGAGGNRVAAFADGSLDEALIFEFSPTQVSLLESVIFERGGGGQSTFELFVDGGLVGSFDIGGGPANTQETLDFSGLGLVGSSYEFRAIASGNGFRVSELTVARVAEPGTLALASIGLLGLSAMSRRRRQVAVEAS
ncbi:MAG: hypothetical protein AAGA68_07310 [Pseudomonadota bacterium]